MAQVWAALFLATVAGGWAIYSWDTGVDQIRQSDTALYYFKVVMQYKQEREGVGLHSSREGWQWTELIKKVLSDQRATFQHSSIESFYQASFERYLGTVYRVTGDVTLGYKILVFPLNLLFMLGAYTLFFHLTKKPLLSVFFAVLAAFPIAVPVAGEYFGMGPVTIYSRRNLFTAFVPFIIFFFYKNIQRPGWLVLTFFLLGLTSNLHSSGILLAEVLILTYLFYQNGSFRAWISSAIFGVVVAISGFVAIGGLWGRVESFFSGVLQLFVQNAYASASGFLQKEGIPEGLEFLFYPLRIYSHLPSALLHGITVIVVVISIMALFFRNRMTPRFKGLLLFVAAFSALAYLGFSEFEVMLAVGGIAFAIAWKRTVDSSFELTHCLILSVFLVSFVGMLLFQAGYYFVDDFPLVFDQLRGARFLGLMIFVWLAVLIARIDWHEANKMGKALFVISVFLAVLMTLRQDFRSWIRYKEDPESIALLDVARWSRKHTAENASFLIVSIRFGIVAERNVLIHERGIQTAYGQKLLDEMRGGLPALEKLAREKGMSYIVVKKDQVKLPVDVHPVYENQRYALVKVDHSS